MNIVREDASFKSKALAALGIAVTADALDYFLQRQFLVRR